MQILVTANLRGEIDNLLSLIKRSTQFSLDAVCFCGNIVRGRARWEEWDQAKRTGRIPNRNRTEILEEALEDLKLYKQFCNLIDSLGIPVLVIPGNLDAPEERYFLFMQQTAFQSDNVVLMHENMVKLESYLFTGFGGELTRDEKEDYFVLEYPRQEVLFGTRRMRFLNPPRILMFYSPPVSKLDREQGTHKGSELVNEIIESVAPSFLFCGGSSEPGLEEIGRTVVVNPGSLADGHFAVVNTKMRDAQFLKL